MTIPDGQFRRSDGVELKEYVEAQLKSLDRHTETRLRAIEEATGLARDSMNVRLNGMNEFRDAMKDLGGRMATLLEVEAIAASMRSEIGELKRAKDIAEGKASQSSVLWLGLATVIGWILGIIGLLK